MSTKIDAKKELNSNFHDKDYLKERIENFKKYIIFMQERFDPTSHFLMILLFVYAHVLTTGIKLDLVDIFLLFLGTTIFFFKLRLYDELKDYATDIKNKPHRPLPRGLLTPNEVKKMIEKRIVLEIVIFSLFGMQGGIGIALAIGYSLLMYKEFFIGKHIRPHLTTYATSHTIVTFLLSMAIFSAISEKYLWELPSEYFSFALMSWLLFNIFELGRKTYQPSEEKEGIESYSKIWTKPGAFILVLGQALVAYYLLHDANIFHLTNGYYFYGVLCSLIIVGLLYIFSNAVKIGKIYRIYSSLFIVLTYVGVIATLY